jgi:hypothetical protein
VTPENSSSGNEEEEESDGGQAPLRGGIPRPPHQEPQRRQRSRRPWRVWKHPPPGGPWKRRRAAEAPARAADVWERCSGDDGRYHSACRALEEEEAGLLHLQVSSRFSRRSGFEGPELNFLSPCSQGGTDCPRLRAR